MPRSWPERLAKRIGRLADNLDTLEAKGRTSDKAYSRMLSELGDLCCQILDARDQANAELAQARTDTIFHKRKIAEEWTALNAEREAFQAEREKARQQRKAEETETARIRTELSQERRILAEATAQAEEARRKYGEFMDQMKKASARL